LKDKDNTINITVISLGPERVKQSLTKALAMGADEAIHLQTDNSINDCMAIANIITNEIKKKQYDLILFGKKSVDQDNNQVGMIIGEINGIPCISNCSEFVIEDNKIVANREVEGSIEVFEGEFPVIITHEKGKNELRYPSLKDLMAAKKKCPERERTMTEIRVIDKGHASRHMALEYAAGERQIGGFMRDKCSRVLLYAIPKQ